MPGREQKLPAELQNGRKFRDANEPANITFEELQLATRNSGMPLEALRYDLTPTGLHYVLTHFDIPNIDPERWRLQIRGSVLRRVELSLNEIRLLPAVRMPVTLECAGNGRSRLTPRPRSQPWIEEACSTAVWTGVPLKTVLAQAGPHPETVEVVFWGADHGIQDGHAHTYGRSLDPEHAMRPEILLAYEMNGRPLEPQHGAPLRLVVPGWYGMASVKWLTSIEAIEEPFKGFQQSVAYRYQREENDPGSPVTAIRPRALMVPPGIPETFSRRRRVDSGRVSLTGRAWSGTGSIVRVEVGIDGVWHDADLGEQMGEFTWRGWSFDWDARTGDHVLSCRATDAEGEVQPLEQPWNFQGMGNNTVQTVHVCVV
ncbi:MAG: molybdopterin-dependent oxidoreductase [Actinobacteria bacterium]|nr:molybdopterin-dependent oxidoreductase [Actinomycetota bacterium]